MSTEILDAVSRAVWVAGCCDDATYDEAVAAAKRGSPADASALLFNQEVAKAAISAMQSEISAERDAAVSRAERAEARGKVLVEALKDAAADLDDYSPLTGNTVQTVASMRVRAAISAWEKAMTLDQNEERSDELRKDRM